VNDAPKENAAPVTAMPNIPVQKSNMDATGLILGIITIIIYFMSSIGEKGGGVLSVFLLPFFFSAFPLGFAGVIISAIAISRNRKAGLSIKMAIAGLVVSIIGIALLINYGASAQ
jgi:hypothetical protein